MIRLLLLLTTFVLLTSAVSFSQNSSSRYSSPPVLPTNTERYNVDYALKDYVFVNGDSTILEQIDLISIEHLRSNSVNVEIMDNNTGQLIILFHTKKKPTAISHEHTTNPSNL